MEIVQCFFSGFFLLLLVLLIACGYIVLAIETFAWILGHLRRRRLLNGLMTLGIMLIVGFAFIGIAVGTNCHLFALFTAGAAFITLAPPIRLVRILQEECKSGAEEAKCLYALSLALMSFPSVYLLYALVFYSGFLFCHFWG